MLTPTLNTVTKTIQCAASATQSLPDEAIAVLIVTYTVGTGTALDTATVLSVVAGTPSSGDVQFTGTATAPSKTLTLSSAAVVDSTLEVTYVVAGAIPVAA